LRVSVISAGERAALKNDLLFCRSRETGIHAWKVVLLRKESKKSGHACEVKLLPRELSNGDGRADATTVLEGVVPVVEGFRDNADVEEWEEKPDLESETVAFEVPEDTAVKVGVEVAEGVLSVDVELLELTLSCRRWIEALGSGGGSRRSKVISPLLSSSLNSAGS
jgi:hypothetical protein